MKKYKFKSDDDNDKKKINEEVLDDCDCFCNKRFLIIFAIIILSLVFYFVYRESVEERVCLSDKCKEKSCKAVRQGLISGTLCMDLCVYQTVDLDACLPSSIQENTKNRFFPLNDPPDAAIFCNILDIENRIENIERYYSKPRENISLIEFEEMIVDLIASKLDYMPQIYEKIEFLFDFADVNRDEMISLPEARSLWSLLDNKHTFYMLMLNGRHYVPRILRFCGDIIEIEQLTSTYLFSIKDDSFLPSIFPMSYKWTWPSWVYRVKIVIGILEFMLESESFNRNDEYGYNSLYLCSPIETSFGYNYAYDVKLVNFEDLLTARELESKQSDRYCSYDTDCVYTDTCVAKCDKLTNRCTSYLAEPQVVSLCKFMKIYLLDQDSLELNDTKLNLANSFKDILKRCWKLSNITLDNSLFSFAMSKVRKTNSIMRFNKSSDSMSKSLIINESINRHLNLGFAMEYSLFSNELKSLLWSFIRFTKDPAKPKKPSQHGSTTVAPNNNQKNNKN